VVGLRDNSKGHSGVLKGREILEQLNVSVSEEPALWSYV
jgi:hypothetical protein